MSTSYVFFVAVFLLLSITTRCTVGNLVKSPLSWIVCGETSWSRETLITNFAEKTDVCKYHLKVYSPRVVQLHVEFSTTLAQPTDNNGTLECVHQYLEIAGLRFCGTHNEQHIYVPFNGTQGVDEITLTVRFASQSRPTGETFVPFRPNWYLRILQLQSDFYNLAPTGCLQYYIEDKGVITSFNYNDGRGIYPSNMNYTICIWRPVKSISVQLRFLNFDICDGDKCDQELPPGELGICDGDKCDQKLPRGLYCTFNSNEDYIFIPRSFVLSQGMPRIGDNYFCGRSLLYKTVVSLPNYPDVFQITVFSGNHTNTKKSGFEIEYALSKEV